MAKMDAFGTVLKRSGAVVAAVRNLSGPSISLDTSDVTTHDSAGGWREFIATLIDAGEVTLELVWDPDNASHNNVRGDLVARTSQTYSIEWPDVSPAVFTFVAFVTAFQPEAPVDGELSASVTLKITGAVTFA